MADTAGTRTAEDFPSLADPYRRELLAHCYRMLGSVHDAEDLVQETYLRAWRGYAKFEGRSSLRTWLYRIATSACLTALEGRTRRPMPTGIGGPADPEHDLVRRPEVPWLQPAPDALTGADANDPAAIVTERDSVRLALVAALQHLPPRQRAVLVLRDVLRWRAAEVAELLELSTAAVNSLLQRARAQLEQVAPAEDDEVGPLTTEQRELVEEYVAAFERKDVDAIVALFTEDTVWEMPPFEAWYLGPAHIAEHLDTRCPGGPGDFRLVPVNANGQAGVAQYLRDGDEFRAFSIQLLTFRGAAISHVVTFLDTSLFDVFGLPLVHGERTAP